MSYNDMWLADHPAYSQAFILEAEKTRAINNHWQIQQNLLKVTSDILYFQMSEILKKCTFIWFHWSQQSKTSHLAAWEIKSDAYRKSHLESLLS